MKIGYACISTADQHLHMQEDALKSAGCEEIYTDVIRNPGLLLKLHARLSTEYVWNTSKRAASYIFLKNLKMLRAFVYDNHRLDPFGFSINNFSFVKKSRATC